MDKVNNEETTLEVVRSRSPIAIAFLICLVVYILNRIMKDVLPCLYSLRRRRSTSDEEEDLPSENVKFATNLHETEHEDINAGDAVRLRGNDTDKYHVVGSKIGNGERFTCYARPYVSQDQSPDNLELVKSAGDSRRRRRSTSDEEEDLLSEDVKIATNPPETEPKDIKVGDVVKEKDSTRHYVVQDFTQNEEDSPSYGEPDKFCGMNRDELQSVKSAGDSPRRRRSTSDEEEDLPSENVKIATNPPETEPEDINAGDAVRLRGNDTDKYHVVGSKIGNGERFTCYARPYVGQDQSPDNLELVKSAGDSRRRRRSTSDEEEDLLSEDVKIATNPPETEHEDINVGDVVRIRGKCMDEYHVVRSKLGNGERFSCSATPLVSQDLSPDNLELIKSAGEDALDMVIGTEYLCSRKMLVQVEGEPLHPVTLEENDKFIVSKDFRNGMVEGKNSRYEQSLYVPALLLKKSKELNR